MNRKPASLLFSLLTLIAGLMLAGCGSTVTPTPTAAVAAPATTLPVPISTSTSIPAPSTTPTRAVPTPTLTMVATPSPGAVETITFTLGAIQWKETIPLPNASSAPFVSFRGQQLIFHNGYVYIFGGQSARDARLTTVYFSAIQPDGTLAGWLETTSLPGRYYDQVVVKTGNYVYLLTGADGADDVFYAPFNADGSIGAWKKTASLSPSRQNFAAVSHGNFIYATGGNSGGNQKFVQYTSVRSNGSLNPWAYTTSLPAAIQAHTLIASDGYLYAFGGINNNDAWVTTVYFSAIQPDGTLADWETTTPLPQKMEGYATFETSGYVYLLGGGASYYARILEDHALGVWEKATALPSRHVGLRVGATNGFAYAIGGYDFARHQSTVYYRRLGLGDEQFVAPIAVGFFIPGVGDVPTGVLLGGAQQGRWLSLAEVSPRGGEIYQLYSAEAYLGTAEGGTSYSQPPNFLSDQLIDLTPAPQAGQEIFAIGGEWNALPRPFQVLSNDIDLYRETVAERLRINGLADSAAQIHQTLRVDLDGNGGDEVLIAAAHFANRQLPVITAGDYSLIILRTVVSDTVVSIPLVENYYTTDESPAVANLYTVMAILDLNGDGRMEVVVRGERYEGQLTAVYEVEGTTSQPVLLSDHGSTPATPPAPLSTGELVIAGALDDHYDVAAEAYRLRVKLNGAEIFDAPAAFAHGRPFGGVFSNFAELSIPFDLNLLRAGPNQLEVNLYGVGGGEWMCWDYMRVSSENELIRIESPSKWAYSPTGVDVIYGEETQTIEFER